MTSQTGTQNKSLQPLVEIHVADGGLSAAAGGGHGSRLSSDQILALQATLGTLVSGFRPPKTHEEGDGLRLASLEIELGFKVETGSGSVLKLIFDASGEASITAKVVWSRAE